MACMSVLALNLNFCFVNKSGKQRMYKAHPMLSGMKRNMPPAIRPVAVRFRVRPINMALDLDLSKEEEITDSRASRVTYHPDLWEDDFIQSLETPYGAPSYSERRESVISEIKEMLHSMGDGEISPSAYDTAWLARVPAIDGSASPQFPQTIEWLVQNQHNEGSWGSHSHFSLSDRLLNTLASVIALATWQTGHLQVKQGLDFLRENVEFIEEGSQCKSAMDFDILFPAMLKDAESLQLSLPYDLPCLKSMWRKREDQLANISVDTLHSIPTSMLRSLEGLMDIIDWNKIMNVQSKDGSFLSSPASTACVLMHTMDGKCFDFLNNLLVKFGSCVPALYPLDLLERLLIVDNAERLGVERHFENEIRAAVNYVYRYWSERGIGYGRDSLIGDLYTTALGFRTLRVHGYQVSPDVLEKFKDESGHFFSNLGEENIEVQVRSMITLFRASQLAFPGEEVMDEARIFTERYLREIIAKRSGFNNKKLLQEVEYALEYPSQMNMPRLEARSYIDTYEQDYAWLGKNIYKTPYVNNEKWLELAKLDFNILQSLHQAELKQVSRWWKDSGLARKEYARHRVAEIYFSVGNFEPQFSLCRIAFGEIALLQFFLDDLYDNYGTLDELRLFTEAAKRFDLSATDVLPDYMKIIYKVWYELVNELANETMKQQGRDMINYIRKYWEEYFDGYMQEAEWIAAQYIPPFDDYVKNAIKSVGLAPNTIQTMTLMGEILTDDILPQIHSPAKLHDLVGLTWRLTNDATTFKAERARGEPASSVTCYMKDNPGINEKEAVDHIYGIIDNTMKELNFEFYKHDNIPPYFKKHVFLLRKCVQLFYKFRRDDYSIGGKETKDYVRKSLIEPVSI